MYPYFDIVLELEWSKEAENYAGCRVATGRVSHAGKVKVVDPDKKRDTLAVQVGG